MLGQLTGSCLDLTFVFLRFQGLASMGGGHDHDEATALRLLLEKVSFQAGKVFNLCALIDKSVSTASLTVSGLMLCASSKMQASGLIQNFFFCFCLPFKLKK